MVFYVGMSGVCCCLGVWQSQRYGWKKDLIADKTEKFEKPCLEIKDLEPDIASKYEGRRVKFDGYYDHSREVLWGPHSAPVKDNHAQGMSTNAQGYNVITPLMLKSGNGAIIYVNRGWVMRDAQSNAPMPYDKPNWASITGVVQKPEEQHFFSPVNSPLSGRLFWLSGKDLVKASRSKIGVNTQYDDGSPQVSDMNEPKSDLEEPLIVEEIKESIDRDAKVKYPIPRDAKYAYTDFVTPETHVAYAFSWFALSGFALYVAYMAAKRRKRNLFTQARRQGKL